MSRLAFAKHMAFAGQRYSPIPAKLFRTLGMFLHYSQYMRHDAFSASRFSLPPAVLSDPTEQGQFSNMAGKAIADFLSKRIDHSIATMNYEAAMREMGLPLYQVRRPDLLAFTQSAQFAIEAKGRAPGDPGNMANHKAQSLTGGIPVQFTVACVTYDLYNSVKCNYHDPFNDNVPYNSELLAALTKDYYSGLAQYLNEDSFEIRETQHQGEKFHEVDLSRPMRYFLEKEFLGHPMPFRWWRLGLSLLLPWDIRAYAKYGITRATKPFLQGAEPSGGVVYIDNDRVGLRIK